MPQYTYTAIDDDGKPVDGTLEAENEDELATNLSQMGYYLLTATTAKRGEKAKAKKRSKGGFYFGNVKQREIITFTHHLSTVLSTGIPILQGLEDLVEQTEDARFRNILAETRDDVKGGSSLSDAMAKHPGAFSDLYVNLLKAGEVSGEVDRVLAEIARFLEWQEEMTANVKQITIYPTVVFGAIVLLVGYLFAFVFPTFTKILTQLNVPLPLPTLYSNSHKQLHEKLLVAPAYRHSGRYSHDKSDLTVPLGNVRVRPV
ncbi:MAG: type II secretion system F family protein [Planctomycetota bacterium]|jgi:type IV pilus assembly protein PilC